MENNSCFNKIFRKATTDAMFVFNQAMLLRLRLRKGDCDNDSQEESTLAFVVALKDGSFQYSQKGNGQKRSM